MYNKTTWVNGDLITAAKLNNIEDGIEELYTYVTPQMYGAAADGSTDDTAAFQAALNSGYNVYVPMSMGEVYKITDTLTVPSTCKQIYSDGIGGIYTDRDCIKFDLTETADTLAQKQVKPLFSIDMQCLHIVGVSVASATYTDGDGDHRVGVFADLSSTLADKDFRLELTRVTGFNRLVEFRGRGCEIYNCLISDINVIGTFNWDDADQTGPYPAETGQRAICFKNNRLHTINDAFIRVESGHAYGLTFQNNTIDNGRGCLVECEDEAWNWLIEGNLFQAARNVTNHVRNMYFNSGADHCIIANNVFSARAGYYSSGITDPPESWITFMGTMKNSIIANNTFERSKSYLLALSGSTNSVVSGNVFYDVSAIYTSGTRAAIYLMAGTYESMTINSNALILATNPNVVLFMIANPNSTKLDNSKVVGNACPAFLDPTSSSYSYMYNNSTNFVTDEQPPA